MPVGTNELSKRCRELSRQRGLPVNVVNVRTLPLSAGPILTSSGQSNPYNKHALDPEKLSHHVHRIGYHFESKIVEEAAQELGFVPLRGGFVSEREYQQQHHQSRMAQIMASHGFKPSQAVSAETPAQVRAAIKELFPNIPAWDLDEIFRHAWEEGTNRVGTSTNIDLPSRVQLAVAARVRHQYTDYDILLRAFNWEDARREVEAVVVRKLVEWRGEQDCGDDNELEEIIRETIVLDDEDDDDYDTDDATDAVSSHDEEKARRGSDSSVEFLRQVAVVEDLGAESMSEANAPMPRGYGLRRRREDPAKINAQRNRIRGAILQARNAPVQQTQRADQPGIRSSPLAQTLNTRMEERRAAVPPPMQYPYMSENHQAFLPTAQGAYSQGPQPHITPQYYTSRAQDPYYPPPSHTITPPEHQSFPLGPPHQRYHAPAAIQPMPPLPTSGLSAAAQQIPRPSLHGAPAPSQPMPSHPRHAAPAPVQQAPFHVQH